MINRRCRTLVALALVACGGAEPGHAGVVSARPAAHAIGAVRPTHPVAAASAGRARR